MSEFEWVKRRPLRSPIAVLAFTGWGDAGESSSAAVRHLIAAHEAETLARVDPDSFFDFQVNRPVVSLDDAGIRSLSWPSTELLAVSLRERDMVVVIGDEPNFNWKRFTRHLCDALVELDVRLAITLGAFIGQVAHTLPVPVVGSSTSTRTITAHGLLPSRYQGPTGIIGVLNQALAARSIDTISLWAAVPHYLSNQAYPPGVEALVRKVVEIVGISVDMGELERRTAAFRETVDAAVRQSEDLRAYVHNLEVEGLAPEGSGDELLAEIERYLRDA